MQLGVDFTEGGKPENPEKNPRSTGEINYDNSIDMFVEFSLSVKPPRGTKESEAIMVLLYLPKFN